MEKYQRMLDKKIVPSEIEIKSHLGVETTFLLDELDCFLICTYNLEKSLKFPFGNHYGWGYKYFIGKKHVCYIFFEVNAITMMIQIGDGQKGLKLFSSLSEYTQTLWENRYPCGNNGGWIHYRITNQNQIEEVKSILDLKYHLT